MMRVMMSVVFIIMAMMMLVAMVMMVVALVVMRMMTRVMRGVDGARFDNIGLGYHGRSEHTNQ